MIHVHDKTKGFTLIELMLALAFVSFILLFAITAILQVMGTYNKGLAVKEINQAGRSALEDMSRMAKVSDPNAINTSAINNGRVCFGGVSYVWNKWDTAEAGANKYEDGARIVLARVNDAGGAMCSNSGSGYPTVQREDAVDLLTGRVWVHNINVTKSNGGELIDLQVQLTVADDPSDPVLEDGVCTGASSGQFCATSRFNTTVTTRGGQ